MSEIDTTSEDWSARATSTIVGYVDTVRGATTGKAMVASRLAVYGVAAGLVAIVMVILLLVLLVRFMVIATGYVPGIEEGQVWLAYGILGAVFLLAGWIMWRLRGK
jgi:heme/copper-type cytochrome/quinol oxidase subunit 4